MPSNKSSRPLLFINQPFSRTPSVKMQDVYTSKQEYTEIEENNVKGRQNVPAFEMDQGKIPIPIEMTKQEKPKDNLPGPSFNRVKSFKEMTILERLEYLINFPRVLPPVPCVFYTTDKNYQGYLIDYIDNQVTIKFHDKTTINLSVDELKDIIMIGIKK